MGQSRSGAELASKLFRAGQFVDDAARTGVAKSALFVKTSVVAQLGGVTRLRGVGKSGGRIGVRYDVKSVGRAPSALIRMTGAAHLLERDTKAHTVGPRRNHKAIRLADGSVRRSVFHPGTKGKHPFERGVSAALPRVPQVMMAEQAKALRKAFS